MPDYLSQRSAALDKWLTAIGGRAFVFYYGGRVMPRYRKLHTKTVESLDVNDMPDDFTRLFWVLLPLGLCQEGRGIDNTAWIKAKLFPLRLDVTPVMIEAAMEWLHRRGMIRRYTVNGRPYFCVPNATWHKYQGKTDREADTEYPPPPDAPAQHSEPTPELVASKSSSDADADANTDADACAQDQRATSPHKKQTTPAMQTYRSLYGKFRNADDLADLLDAEKRVGSTDVQSAIRWAHAKGIEPQRCMSSIVTAALNWQSNERPHNNGGGAPDPVPKEPIIVKGIHRTPEWLGGDPDG